MTLDVRGHNDLRQTIDELMQLRAENLELREACRRYRVRDADQHNLISRLQGQLRELREAELYGDEAEREKYHNLIAAREW